jgi:hypothetical protein
VVANLSDEARPVEEFGLLPGGGWKTT